MRWLLFALVLVLAACGGADDSGPGIDETNTPGTPDAGTASTGGGSATAILGGETHEFSTAACTLGGAVLLSFEEGDDHGSISSADPVVLIRLAIGSGEWVDDGAAHEPERSGDTFTWSGTLADLVTGDEASVQITVRCGS